MMKPGMKKVAASILSLSSLAWVSSVLADIRINVEPPANLALPSNTSLNDIIANALKIVFIVATLAVLVMLIWGAFQWITSGGDKDAVGNARKRITAALIGLAILALAFVIVYVVGQILGINILGNLVIPSLNSPTTPTTTTTR